eukprot:192264_1
MASAKHRLFHRISYFNPLSNKSAFRLILSQKQCISISNLPSKTIFVSNPHAISTNHLSTKHTLRSFTKMNTKKDDDDDDDSDFSDFSDFSDSDDSDVDEKMTKQTRTPTTNQKQWQFDHGEISPDLLMKDRLIISNLNFSTNRNDIWELCENYGSVVDVHLPANKNRDFHNRGFGFVTFETDKDAQNALDNIAGSMFNSRQLRAGYARRDTDRSSGTKDNYRDNNYKSDRSDFKFTTSPPKSEIETIKVNRQTPVNEVQNVSKKLSETAISISGLPGNVNLAQITRMFGDLGDISNISLSPYMMFGHSFMNAVVSVKLRNGSIGNASIESDDKQAAAVDERNIKDRSVEKGELKTMRTNVGETRANKANVGGIDPDILAKEIDELLADTDDEDESTSGSDSGSDSDGDAESSSDDDSDSDSDLEDKKK